MTAPHIRFHWFPRNRVFLRVFAIFGGFLVALTVVYGLLIIPLQHDSLLKILYSQAATVSRSIVQACSDAMLTDDYGYVVDHNLQVLQNNKAVQRVVIVPKQGAVIQILPDEWAMKERDRAVMPDTIFERESYGVLTDAVEAPCTATPRPCVSVE